MIALMYGFFIVLLLAFLLYLFKSNNFFDYEIINLPPIVKNGLTAVCKGNFVKANDKGKVNEDWFHRETLILGYDKNNVRGSAEANFLFRIPSKNKINIEDSTVSMMIEAERIHGGLHSHLGPNEKNAVIQVNEEIVDKFRLIQKMPNGVDYGYRNVGPIPIDKSFLHSKYLKIILKIEEDMAWDIDKVILKITSGNKRLSVTGSMIAGAVISVIIGLLAVFLEQILSYAK